MKLLRRFWNWLVRWWRGPSEAELRRQVSAAIERKVAMEIAEGKLLDEQIAEELAKPEIAKHVVVSPKKRRELQRTLGDPSGGGPGMVRGADGIWRSTGDTPFETIVPFVGSAQEAEATILPRKLRQPKPTGGITCVQCFGIGWLGNRKCQRCDGKGWYG